MHKGSATAHAPRTARISASRVNAMEALFFLCNGIAVVVPFFLNRNPLVKCAVVISYCMLLVADRQRIHMIRNMILFASVCITHLFLPQGRIIWSCGFVIVADESLLYGIERGLNLVGVSLISTYSIRENLSLPGKIGILIAEVHFFFRNLLHRGKEVRTMRKSVLDPYMRIDRILVEAWNADRAVVNNTLIASKNSRKIIAVAVTLLAWSALFLPIAR